MPSKLELIIEDDSTTLVVNIEDNPRLSDTIPLSTTIDNQLTRNLDGYYVPPTSWEDLRDRPNSTTEEIDDAVSRSEQNASSIEGLEQSKVDKVDGKQLSTEDYSTAEKTKLSGIQAGATANATNAQLRDRATHTGVQAIGTVSGLQDELDSINALVADALQSTSIYDTIADGLSGVADDGYFWVYPNSLNSIDNLTIFKRVDATTEELIYVQYDLNDFMIEEGANWEAGEP